jgi:hypothetical protein
MASLPELQKALFEHSFYGRQQSVDHPEMGEYKKQDDTYQRSDSKCLSHATHDLSP